MPPARCGCGFTEDAAEDYTLSDHLYEVFAPDDGTGPDGEVHLEGETALLCMCGAGGSAARLDAHFLEIFTPGDAIGRDGARHRPTDPQPARRGLRRGLAAVARNQRPT
jgi:hypothetical protein